MADVINLADVAAAQKILRKAKHTAEREKAMASVVENEWESDLLFDAKGRVDSRAGRNVTLILTHHEEWAGAFYFDSFGGRVVIAKDCPAGRAGEEWTDLRDKLTSDWLEASKYALRPSKTIVVDSVNAVARMREVHPVKAYLQGLQWDGRPRVNLFAAKYLGARPGKGEGAKARYLAKVSSILFLGPVARVMRPGCMLKTVPILEGPQDAGKSRAIRALCPREEWFSDSEILYGSKDAYQGLRGKWLIELAEIDKDLRGRASSSTIKAFISSPSDYYRDPFGRRFADNPRQGAFIGSTNHSEYLTDETGGSRWLPFRCGRPDVEAIERDRDQLWAEAFERFSAGESWWLDDGEVLSFARDEQASRYAEDVWTGKIQAAVAAIDPEALTTDAILLRLGVSTSEQGRSEQMRVSSIMTSLGWTNLRRRNGGERVRLWRKVSQP